MTLLVDLFLTFFKIGAFTFGGGYAMIPMITEQVVSKGWLTYQTLIDFIAVSESTPGPFAINVATFVGSVQSGIPGSIAATLGVVTPSFIIISIIARFFIGFSDNKYVKGAIAGIRPTVIGIIATAVLKIAISAFFPLFGEGRDISAVFAGAEILPIAIFLIMLAVSKLRKKPLSTVALLGCSAALGVVLYTAAVFFQIPVV